LLVVLIGLQIVSLILESQQTGLFSNSGSILADLPWMRISGASTEIEFQGFWALWRWDFTLYLPLAFLLFKARVLNLKSLVLVVLIALISAVLKFTRAPVLNVITICIVGMWAVRSDVTSTWTAAFRRFAVVLVIVGGFLLLFVSMQAVLMSESGLPGGRPADALLAYVGGHSGRMRMYCKMVSGL